MEVEGISVFWATHLIDEVEDGDDVVVLSEGNLVAKGTVSDVIRSHGVENNQRSFSRLGRGSRPSAAEGAS